MTLEMNRPKCCCFTGHRENKLKRSEKDILEDLKQAINQAIDDIAKCTHRAKPSAPTRSTYRKRRGE